MDGLYGVWLHYDLLKCMDGLYGAWLHYHFAEMYRWFIWGMSSLPKGKSRSVFSVAVY